MRRHTRIWWPEVAGDLALGYGGLTLAAVGIGAWRLVASGRLNVLGHPWDGGAGAWFLAALGVIGLLLPALGTIVRRGRAWAAGLLSGFCWCLLTALLACSVAWRAAFVLETGMLGSLGLASMLAFRSIRHGCSRPLEEPRL